MPVAPTRDFWIHVLQSKIEATIRNPGDRIGWESDEETVGPRALSAKESFLRAIPYLLPIQSDSGPSLYRPVLEHGDFGIHNTSIAQDMYGEPLVTSLYDWETGCIVPAVLSDPMVAVGVDLTAGKDGKPSVTQVPEDSTNSEIEMYAGWACHYIEVGSSPSAT